MAELPKLPKVGPICYAMTADVERYKVPLVGKRLPGVYDVALWSTDQMLAFQRETAEACAKLAENKFIGTKDAREETGWNIAEAIRSMK